MYIFRQSLSTRVQKVTFLFGKQQNTSIISVKYYGIIYIVTKISGKGQLIDWLILIAFQTI